MGDRPLIRMIDPTRFDDGEAEALREAFERVLASGTFILGEEVSSFEHEIAELLSVEHAVGVSSGTDALLMSLLALGIGPGDEVIVPAYSFFATAGAVVRCGATPVFVDIDLRDFMAPAWSLAARVSARTRAIVAVHLFGQPADIEPLKKLGVPIVEDAAQSIGAKLNDQPVGGLGSLGAFSFFPTKNLAALGDGGLVTTRDPLLAERVRMLRVHGARDKNRHEVVGGNFRLDALQAAFLRARLPLLESKTQRRAKIAARYVDGLRSCGLGAPNDGQPIPSDDVVLLPRVVRGEHVFNQFVIRVAGSRRDDVRSELLEKGIETAVYYPETLPRQPALATFPDARTSFPNAERAAAESLALPIDPALDTDELDRIVDALATALRR
jgi:dTDP-4-amino-4,6-dideoxygalactose transaminase